MKNIKKLILDHKGKIPEASIFEALTYDVLEGLDVELVSIWLFNENNRKLTCNFSVDKNNQRDLRGTELSKDYFPKYFDAIIQGVSIRAENVYNNSNTKELVEGYFRPNDIKSLLDYIIYDFDKPVGLICCETTSDHRRWSDKDVNYVRTLTVMAGVELKSAKEN